MNIYVYMYLDASIRVEIWCLGTNSDVTMDRDMDTVPRRVHVV